MATTAPAIALLRGRAAAMVVAAHALPAFGGGASFGYTGVDLFFVLSGFLFAPCLDGQPVAHLWRHLLPPHPPR